MTTAKTHALLITVQALSGKTTHEAIKDLNSLIEALELERNKLEDAEIAKIINRNKDRF